MEMIALIMSGLALLAAIVCLVMIYQEKKRSTKRNTALIQYIERHEKDESHYRESVAKELGKIVGRAENLEKGIIPDYEEAKAAANAVNDFSKGISNILGFDPMEALKAERAKKEAGDPD